MADFHRLHAGDVVTWRRSAEVLALGRTFLRRFQVEEGGGRWEVGPGREGGNQGAGFGGGRETNRSLDRNGEKLEVWVLT